MDDDYLTNNNIQQSNRSFVANMMQTDSANTTASSTNNEILLRAVEEHMKNTSICFNNKFLSDVRINVEDKQFYAHGYLEGKPSCGSGVVI